MHKIQQMHFNFINNNNKIKVHLLFIHFTRLVCVYISLLCKT
jgi:hypothetical protein